ncbi:hypothetical protein [Paenibacillus illinoisensis]|uniref:hypothetical protein n=1 Tax=Paenibacillus illinoisensis TaxID=59845 RepID=UPI000FDBACEA|nr:hypothetical protein [Paenibacillus illinoisensis]
MLERESNEIVMELLKVRSQNRELKNRLDILSIKLLEQAGSYSGKKAVIKTNTANSNQYNTYLPFPVDLSSKGLFSRFLFVTKKFAYFYAVYGIKFTLKKLVKKLLKR